MKTEESNIGVDLHGCIGWFGVDLTVISDWAAA